VARRIGDVSARTVQKIAEKAGIKLTAIIQPASRHVEKMQFERAVAV
jgi:hypothetical protein